MNTYFNFQDKTFHLVRYPEKMQHPSWQAWDAADELLLEHLFSQENWQAQRLLILNDDFGALSTALHPCQVYHVSDSYIAQKSCEINRRNNHCDEDRITYLSSLDCLPENPDWVIIKIPRTLALLEYQLVRLQQVIGENSKIVAGAKAKAIQKSMLGLFEKHLGKTHTSLARKKARLVFCQPDWPAKHSELPPQASWQVDDQQLVLHNHANVFSRSQLDIGARLLMQHLPDCHDKQVIDLGCGNGVIGLSVLKHFANARVCFVDESFMAVASAKDNVQRNFPDKLEQCDFFVSNCLESLPDDYRADVVLCNPPFHQQHAITDHIARQMFSDSHKHLNKGGELRIIGNRHLDYPQKLKQLFGGYQVVASDAKFSILSSYR